ncbi:MAG TPA: AI-2E family transporter [Methanotrichaceae archaeon]|nr:AI-2E family transporter [Methanotrichaceae archaeon]
MRTDHRFDIAAAAIIILALIITLYATKYFLSTVLLSIVFVYLLKPIYAGIYRITKHAWISSLLSLAIVFLAIMALLFLLSSVLLTEIQVLQTSGDIQFSSLTEDLDIWIESSLPEPVSTYLENVGDIPAAVASFAYPVVRASLSSFASNIPILIAQSLVAIFFTYYLLIDGQRFAVQFVSLLPAARRGLVRHFLEELNSIYNTLFTVYFTTAILSGILAAAGLLLLGIPYPLVWGTIIAVFALLPLLGPPFIFVPMIIYYLFMHDYIRSVFLALFCIVLMVIPENIIRPQLAFMSARIHPLITVLAYTAPVFVMGIVGVIVGPALYGFLLALYRTTVHYQRANQEL